MRSIGSLFSGIDALAWGLERGLARGGVVASIAWQVENDPHARTVLDRRFPHAQKFGDITALDVKALARVDVVCGGFPCQDLSVAGRQAGLVQGERSSLWWYFRDVVNDIRPTVAVVENVAHGWRSWVPAVRTSFATVGYASIPLLLSAADVGAPHLRRRCFVVAHPDGVALRHLAERFTGGRPRAVQGPGQTFALDDGSSWTAPRWTGSPPPGVHRVDDGPAVGMDEARLKLVGNAVVVQVAEVIGYYCAPLLSGHA